MLLVNTIFDLFDFDAPATRSVRINPLNFVSLLLDNPRGQSVKVKENWRDLLSIWGEKDRTLDLIALSLRDDYSGPLG